MLVNIKVTGGLNIESGQIYPKATQGLRRKLHYRPHHELVNDRLKLFYWYRLWVASNCACPSIISLLAPQTFVSLVHRKPKNMEKVWLVLGFLVELLQPNTNIQRFWLVASKLVNSTPSQQVWEFRLVSFPRGLIATLGQRPSVPWEQRPRPPWVCMRRTGLSTISNANPSASETLKAADVVSRTKSPPRWASCVLQTQDFHPGDQCAFFTTLPHTMFRRMAPMSHMTFLYVCLIR